MLAKTPQLALVVFAAFAVATAAIAFAVSRSLLGGSQVAASGGSGPVPTEQVPSADVTPEPGETPDTSQPLWYVPYKNADAQKPRYDQVVNGIPIGPSVTPGSASVCASATATPASADAVAKSPLAIAPGYLPAHAVIDGTNGSQCDGRVVFAEIDYVIPAAPGVDGQIRSGAISYFDAQHGGAFQVLRLVLDSPGLRSSLASQSWAPTEIAGHAAALARPIFDAGFGDSAVVIWDDGIETVVRGQSISFDDLMAIARGVVS